MDIQQHKTFNAQAQGALNRICRYLRENGHDIDTEPNELGEQLVLIHDALVEGRFIIDTLEDIDQKIKVRLKENEHQTVSGEKHARKNQC